MAVEGLDAGLRTTGFEDADAAIPVSEPPVPEAADPVKVAIPALKPILQVRPTSVPIAVYEPIQFLDYDDEDDSFGSMQAEPTPELDEPPTLTEFAHVAESQPAAPAPARVQQGFAPVALIDVPVEIPELLLPTARPRIRYGPNPFAPKPEPEPETKPALVTKQAPPPQKPAPAYVQRPAAAAAAVQQEPPRSEPQKNDRDKRQVKPTPPPQVRPVRDRGNAVPAEKAIPEAPAPMAKPKMVPIRKPEPLPPAAASVDVPMLGLPQTETSSKSKLAMVAAIAVTLGAGGYFVFSVKTAPLPDR